VAGRVRGGRSTRPVSVTCATAYQSEVESTGGGVPESSASRRVMEVGIVLVEAQVFGPSYKCVVGQPSRSVVAGPCAGGSRVSALVSALVSRTAQGEFAVGGPGPTVEAVTA
jgi:hypothetical protein